MSRKTPRPGLIVVPHSPGRIPQQVFLPMFLMALAAGVLALRAASPDWRGLGEELRARTDSGPATPAPDLIEPAALGLAMAKVPEPPKAAPKEERPAGAEPPKPAPSADSIAAWDEIKRSAEKVEAERREVERIKEQAAEDLAKNPPPPSNRRGFARLNPAQVAEMQRRQREAMREMEKINRERLRRFEAMIREQREWQRQLMGEIARGVPGGFIPLPPGFDRPLPGMDRMGPPLPGMPQPEPGPAPDPGRRSSKKRNQRPQVFFFNGW